MAPTKLQDYRIYWRVGWDEAGDFEPRWRLVDGIVVPADVVVELRGLRGAPSGLMRFELTADGVFELVRFDLHRTTDGRSIRATDLETLSCLGEIERIALHLWMAVPIGEPEGLHLDSWRPRARPILDWDKSLNEPGMVLHYGFGKADVLETIGLPNIDQMPRNDHTVQASRLVDRSAAGKRRVPLSELKAVAEVYLDNINGKPTKAVQRKLGYSSARTASRRVTEARRAGLLPDTTQGKKQGLSGQQAERNQDD